MTWWKKFVVARGDNTQEKRRWMRMENQETSAVDQNDPPQSPSPRIKPESTSDPESQSFLPGPQIARKMLVAWRIGIMVPFLVAGCLLYLLTCSAPSWRADWSVVRLDLAQTDFDVLYDIAETVTGRKSDSAQSKRLLPKSSFVAARSAVVARDDEANEDLGVLSINMWGWCLKPESDTDGTTICSSESMWFNMDDLLGAATTTQAGLYTHTFSAILIHALIVHGLAMLAAMTAIIPIGLTTWRVFRSKNPTLQGGWFEHVSILFASLLCLVAWIIDRCLQANVSSKLSDTDVKAGYVSRLVVLFEMTNLLRAGWHQ
ncbi:hypothetical protein L198_04075 [Cryptococcus wingfieldii CBS 7118]|uniref:Uncharacterized protein n=1 Tax=Cryptococcus wingfieldii CBS 7118 TaxID=1295528 RepID=A0A1E3J8W3_9TREE|nr:hypothetical protein L198_04075 [Cryptococcus wingfieldii CBS 7118]ODN96361.1 hypothetical protein L198_04075 [Cryptococcus wingfieldii CBS 7118]